MDSFKTVYLDLPAPVLFPLATVEGRQKAVLDYHLVAMPLELDIKSLSDWRKLGKTFFNVSQGDLVFGFDFGFVYGG